MMHSKKSVLSIKACYYFMSAGATVPFFSFKKMKLVLLKFQVFYYVMLCSWGLFINYRALVEMLANQQLKKFILMEILHLVFGSLTNSCTLLISIFRRRIWEEFLQKLAFLENENNLNTLTETETTFIKTTTFSFILYNITVYGFCALGFATANINTMFYFSVYRMMYIVNSSLIIFNINNFLNIIKEKYNTIASMLLVLRNAKRLDARNIRKSREYCWKMHEISKLFNKLIGAPIFFIFFYCGYKLVFSASSNFGTYIKGHDKLTSPVEIIIRLMLNGFSALMPLAVSLYGYKTHRQIKNLQNTCRLLQGSVPLNSESYLELRDMYHQIELQRVKFTAERFFDLERSTIIRYLHVICTYFIAFVQFVILLP